MRPSLIDPGPVPVVNGVPVMMIRMRCPDCEHDSRFMVEIVTPLGALPEIFKSSCKCKCPNRIPKIKKNTPIEKTLMSINAVPLKVLQLANPIVSTDK